LKVTGRPLYARTGAAMVVDAPAAVVPPTPLATARGTISTTYSLPVW
jgi:hypothetical protein